MPADDQPLQAALAHLAGLDHGSHDLPAVLQQVCELARDTIPAATDVSVTLLRHDRAFTAAQSSERALRLDEAQYAGGHGPCVDVAQATGLISVPDLAQETRWPAFCQQALEAGIGGSLSVSLPIQEAMVGALNLYAEQTGAFDERSIEVAQSFAGYAAVAIANSHRLDDATSLVESMRSAMVSRATIEQAKGIIMSREQVDEDTAFAMLSTVSQNSNRKLRDVAQELIAKVTRPS